MMSMPVTFVWEFNLFLSLPPAGALQLYQEPEAAMDTVSLPALTCFSIHPPCTVLLDDGAALTNIHFLETPNQPQGFAAQS